MRHPSYVGIYGTLLGTTAVLLSRGSLLRALVLRSPLSALGACAAHPNLQLPAPSFAHCVGAALLDTTFVERFATLCAGLWLMKVYFALANVYKRLGAEDRQLQAIFGEEWQRYTDRVKWCLIPGII